MVHSGHEASAVDYNFSSLKGFFATAKRYMFPSRYEDAGAQKLLNEWPVAGHEPLVQIADKPTAVVVTTSVNETSSVAGD
jgi:hypothetical protein